MEKGEGREELGEKEGSVEKDGGREELGEREGSVERGEERMDSEKGMEVQRRVREGWD